MIKITKEKIIQVLDDCGVEAWDLQGPNDSNKFVYGILADQILDKDWYAGKYWHIKEMEKYRRNNNAS